MDVLRACQQALAGAVVVARNGYGPASADIAMGVELLYAAVRGTLLNITGNLKGINDPAYVERVSAERKALEIDSGLAAGRAQAALSGSPRSRP